MSRLMKYMNKKLGKNKQKGTFLGTFSFTETWGKINPAKMQEFISSKLPPQDHWTEAATDVSITKGKLGIRLDPLSGGVLVTEGPNSFIPRMMAAVCSIPSLMLGHTPVIALLSYDAIELADGQVPSPKSKVEFFISLIRFESERKATAFSVSVIQLWNTLRDARKKRMDAGLKDADIGEIDENEAPAARLQRRSSITQMSINHDDDGTMVSDTDVVEEGDETGYLEVHAFGMN